jgi:hypothetical protein
VNVWPRVTGSSRKRGLKRCVAMMLLPGYRETPTLYRGGKGRAVKLRSGVVEGAPGKVLRAVYGYDVDVGGPVANVVEGIKFGRGDKSPRLLNAAKFQYCDAGGVPIALFDSQLAAAHDELSALVCDDGSHLNQEALRKGEHQ